MNHRATVLSALVVLGSSAVCAQGETTGVTRTPAEIGIEKAQEQIAKQPNHVPYYSSLAMAYARRARETSDVSYYAKAEETLERSFKIEPDNFEALKVRCWLLLGRHEFAKALLSGHGAEQAGAGRHHRLRLSGRRERGVG